jgi:hypothetical protein
MVAFRGQIKVRTAKKPWWDFKLKNIVEKGPDSGNRLISTLQAHTHSKKSVVRIESKSSL